MQLRTPGSAALSPTNLKPADGSTCKGFICEFMALEGATDIPAFGGWRSQVESLAA
jgi:allophanate hydrolase